MVLTTERPNATIVQVRPEMRHCDKRSPRPSATDAELKCTWSDACIIIMHYAQIMRTGVLATQTPAAHPTTRRAHTRTPSLATEESHTHARAVLCRFFANSDYGGVQASCAFAPRRGSSLRSVASSTNHFAPQAARRSTCRHADTASTTASRRSRRERVAPLRHLRRERAC